MSSYRQIFKSTALVGGAQVVMILIGIVRTKVLALLLGPTGVGIAGLYQSATNLVATITGMGLNISGVRQIAEAAATNDRKKISRTIITLRRVALVSGVLGMGIVLALCVPLSLFSFGDSEHARGIAIVSLTLFCGGVYAGQNALLQGLRRIRDLALSALLGSALGAVASIALVYVLGHDGIAWYLVAVSALGILASWWFARRVELEPLKLSFSETWQVARPLLAMGAAFMVSALLSSGAGYLSNVLIRRELGANALGLYQATWTLSSLYVSIVLNAMSADFAPRLTAAAADHPVMNRLVNEQIEMGLLFAVPGVLATITLAPWVLTVFYSAEFAAATNVIRWQIIGIALRVVSWPIGLILLAKGKARIFMVAEAVFAVINLLLLFACLQAWELVGAGVAFAIFYLLATTSNFAITRSVSGFAWTPRCRRLLALSAAVVAATFAATVFLPRQWALVAGLTLTAVAGIGSLIGMQRLLQINAWQMVRKKLGIVRQR